MTEYVRSALPRYGRIPRGLLRDPHMTAQAVRLYGLLDDYAGPDGRAFPSRATLADAMGVTEKTVDRAKLDLEEGGWLIRQQRFRGENGGQTSTLFLLTAGPVEGTPVSRGVDTGVQGGSTQVSTHEGEPDEGTTPQTPQGADRGDAGLFDVEAVGAACDNGTMSTPTARRSSRPVEVDDADPLWRAFWDVYPRKVSKGAARKAWPKALKKVQGDAGLIIDAAQRFKVATDRRIREEPTRDGRTAMEFVPHPSTWLNQERWSDQTEAERVGRERLHPPRKEDECPIHAGQWKDDCRGCAADAKAKKD
jgi:hypothetical protein